MTIRFYEETGVFVIANEARSDGYRKKLSLK